MKERAREKGIEFNADKLQLKCDKASFIDRSWTPEGVMPYKKKVYAILTMRTPDNAKDLQSFLDIVNYLASYLNQLASGCQRKK